MGKITVHGGPSIKGDPPKVKPWKVAVSAGPDPVAVPSEPEPEVTQAEEEPCPGNNSETSTASTPTRSGGRKTTRRKAAPAAESL